MITRHVRKRVFVGCEGASERSYAKWLQSILDDEGYSFAFDAQIAGGGDPLSIVEASCKLLKQRERSHGRFFAKAILLDSDKLGLVPARDIKIAQLVAAAGAKLIYQHYDHEALLLRHVPGCATRRPPAGQSLAALRSKWPDYEKPQDAMSLGRQFTSVDLRSAVNVEPELREFLEILKFKI